MEYIYENPDIVQVLPKATELHLLHCKMLTKITTAELPEGLDADTSQVFLGGGCLGIFVKVAGESTLTLTQAVEDTPDNRLHMQSVLESVCLDLSVPAIDHVHGINFAACVEDPYLRQAQNLRQAYGNSLKLGIFKGTSQSPLGWTTLDYLELQGIIEFLELGYVLKPVD